MTKRMNLKVVGEHAMHCDGCARSVSFTLRRLPGIDEVKADWKQQRIEVGLSSDETDFEAIRGELDWIGYEVELA